MEAVEVAREITSKIKELDRLKLLLRSAINKQCEAASEYDKQLALTILKIKSGAIASIEGIPIDKPPASLIDKLAKGVCFNERLVADTAEQELRAIESKIRITMAQLNGYQSINRYLAEV